MSAYFAHGPLVAKRWTGEYFVLLQKSGTHSLTPDRWKAWSSWLESRTKNVESDCTRQAAPPTASPRAPFRTTALKLSEFVPN